MEAALAHAERIYDCWADRAYQFLLNYSRSHALIFAEDVTQAAGVFGVPVPPTTRAWGSLYCRAKRDGILAPTNETRHRKNGSLAIVYRSLVCQGQIGLFS